LAYVDDPFRHDIFVSYSHGSDAQGRPALKAWSARFHAALLDELKFYQPLTRTVDVFFDDSQEHAQGLDRMAPLSEQLREAASASAVLLVLMSPHYQASDWCRAERESWWKGQLGSGLPPQGRIALVRMSPGGDWATEGWPRELSDEKGNPLPGYFFYEPPDDIRARPLGWVEGPDAMVNHPVFRERLCKLAGDLRIKLDEVKAYTRRLREQREALERLGAVEGQALYLHGRAEQKQEWESLSDALQDAGYHVTPTEPDRVSTDPAENHAIRTSRVQLMAECDAVLLVAADDGRAVDQDLIAVGKNDRQSARALSQRPLPCAVLDTVGEPNSTPRRQTNAKLLKTDWLDARRAPVVPVVQQWLQQRAGQLR
jgi:hypothetical protein